MLIVSAVAHSSSNGNFVDAKGAGTEQPSKVLGQVEGGRKKRVRKKKVRRQKLVKPLQKMKIVVKSTKTISFDENFDDDDSSDHNEENEESDIDETQVTNKRKEQKVSVIEEEKEEVETGRHDGGGKNGEDEQRKRERTKWLDDKNTVSLDRAPIASNGRAQVRDDSESGERPSASDDSHRQTMQQRSRRDKSTTEPHDSSTFKPLSHENAQSSNKMPLQHSQV